MSREAMSLKAQRQETGCDLGKCPLHLGVSRPAWALSSAGGRCLHTAEVTGSIPVAPTDIMAGQIRLWFALVRSTICPGARVVRVSG